jgi:hypothetical protein
VKASGGVNGGGAVRTGALKVLPVGAPPPTAADSRWPRGRRAVEQGKRARERARAGERR